MGKELRSLFIYPGRPGSAEHEATPPGPAAPAAMKRATARSRSHGGLAGGRGGLRSRLELRCPQAKDGAGWVLACPVPPGLSPFWGLTQARCQTPVLLSSRVSRAFGTQASRERAAVRTIVVLRISPFSPSPRLLASCWVAINGDIINIPSPGFIHRILFMPTAPPPCSTRSGRVSEPSNPLHADSSKGASMTLSSRNFPPRGLTSPVNKRRLLDWEPLRDARLINQRHQSYTLTGSSWTPVQLATAQISSRFDEDKGTPEPAQNSLGKT